MVYVPPLPQPHMLGVLLGERVGAVVVGAHDLLELLERLDARLASLPPATPTASRLKMLWRLQL